MLNDNAHYTNMWEKVIILMPMNFTCLTKQVELKKDIIFHMVSGFSFKIFNILNRLLHTQL